MTLLEYIMEARGFCETVYTADEAFRRLTHFGYKIEKTWIDNIFCIWREDYHEDEYYVPFRFNQNERACKLARIYFTNPKLEEICKELNYSIIKGSDSLYSIKIRNRAIKEGDGSIFGSRSSKGLGAECEIQRKIIDLIKNQKDSCFYTGELKSILDSGALDSAIEKYNKTPDIDFNKLVKLSGKRDTKRNKHGQIVYVDTFEINTTNTQNVINDSGEKIADIIVDDKTNISCKLKIAQLTGLNIRSIFDSNKTFIKAIKQNTEYNNIEDEKDMIPFINFCSSFGLNPEEVFNMYKNKTFGYLKIESYDGKILGCLIQKLIGGNYWYIDAANNCFFVPDTPLNLNVHIKEANISNSGQTIAFKCSINDKVDGKIQFRTDGRGTYPYRLFPHFNVKDLISL